MCVKICVFSDSHGASDAMLRAVTLESPDLCFFLGDGQADLAPVQRAFPDLVIHAVRGNCDLFSPLPLTLCSTVDGVTIFAAHGHRCDVKHDPTLEALRAAGHAAGADVILFGHTHEPRLENRTLPILLNPGSLNGTRPSYGVLVLDRRRIYSRIKYL